MARTSALQKCAIEGDGLASQGHERKSLYRRLFPGLSAATEEWSWMEWAMMPFALVTLIAPISVLVHEAIVAVGLVGQR